MSIIDRIRGDRTTGFLQVRGGPVAMPGPARRPADELIGFLAVYRRLMLEDSQLFRGLTGQIETFDNPHLATFISYFTQLRDRYGIEPCQEERVDLGNVEIEIADTADTGQAGTIESLQRRVCYLARREIGIYFAYDENDNLKMGTEEEITAGKKAGRLFSVRKEPQFIPVGHLSPSNGRGIPETEVAGPKRSRTTDLMLRLTALASAHDTRDLSQDPEILAQRIRIFMHDREYDLASLLLFGCGSFILMERFIDELHLRPWLGRVCERGNADAVMHYLHWKALQQKGKEGAKAIAGILFATNTYVTSSSAPVGGFCEPRRAAVLIYKLLLEEGGMDIINDLFLCTDDIDGYRYNGENIFAALNELHRRYPKILKSSAEYVRDGRMVFQPQANEEILALRVAVHGKKASLQITREALGCDEPAVERGPGTANTYKALTDDSWSYDFGNLSVQESRVQAVKAFCGVREYTAACHLLFHGAGRKKLEIGEIAEILNLRYLNSEQIAGVLDQLIRPVLSRGSLAALCGKARVVWNKCVEAEYIDRYGMLTGRFSGMAEEFKIDVPLEPEERVTVLKAFQAVVRDSLEEFIFQAMQHWMEVSKSTVAVDDFFEGVLFALRHFGDEHLVGLIDQMVCQGGFRRQAAYWLLQEGCIGNPKCEYRMTFYFRVLGKLCASRMEYLLPMDFIVSGRLLPDDPFRTDPKSWTEDLSRQMKSAASALTRLRAMVQLVSIGQFEPVQGYVKNQLGPAAYFQLISDVASEPEQRPFLNIYILDILLSFNDYECEDAFALPLMGLLGRDEHIRHFFEYMRLFYVGIDLTRSKNPADQEEGWLMLLSLQDRRLSRFVANAKTHSNEKVRAEYALALPAFYERDAIFNEANAMLKDTSLFVQKAGHLSLVAYYKMKKDRVELGRYGRGEYAKKPDPEVCLVASQALYAIYFTEGSEPGLDELSQLSSYPDLVRKNAADALADIYFSRRDYDRLSNFGQRERVNETCRKRIGLFNHLRDDCPHLVARSSQEQLDLAIEEIVTNRAVELKAAGDLDSLCQLADYPDMPEHLGMRIAVAWRELFCEQNPTDTISALQQIIQEDSQSQRGNPRW